MAIASNSRLQGKSPTPKNHRMRGFTLLEMLVVAALMAMVMAGLASSFFSLAQTESSVDARLDQSSQLRASMHFLDQTLGRVINKRRGNVQNINEPQFWFEGATQQVRWVGIMPARFGAGGRYFFQLAMENIGNGSGLVIRFAPWSGESDFPSAAQMEARVLVHNLTQFSLQYRGETANTLNWAGQWTQTNELPSHVLLNLATAQAELPIKIIPVRLAGPRSDTSGFSSGGGSR